MPYDGTDDSDRVLIKGGKVRCYAFPFIVMTSNGEMTVPPAFLRRCIHLEMHPPDEEKLTDIIKAHLGPDVFPQAEQLVAHFLERRARGVGATDQLLNAIYLQAANSHANLIDKEGLFDALLKYLNAEAV